MNENRAKAGGQVGMNGEFYAGGTFLPNTQLPKMTPQQKVAKKYLESKQEVEMNKWEYPPSEDVNSIYKRLSGGVPYNRENNKFIIGKMSQKTIDYMGGYDYLNKLVTAYNSGQRWIERG